MSQLDQLEARANRAQESYEAGMAKLLRTDGSPLYSEDEHSERENALRSERHQKLTGIEAEVKAEQTSAAQELSLIENADPLTMLRDDELQRAELRRSFVADEVWSLDEQGLLARLKSVRASGDRATMFLYWQASRSHEAVREDATGRRGLPSALTEEIAAIHDQLGGPDRRQRTEAAKAQEAKAGEVLMAVGSLKHGGDSNPARSYLNRKYARERLPSPPTSARET